ncbi:trypsin-like peptidase domain-containing protein [Streptomyces sp. NPDC051940]|uniref:trypsin-like peptidase domain-containing protein n=1 Tax=Streptomyces sp. NPDC051940 TaxID=3155675 RepID=UPI003434B78E
MDEGKPRWSRPDAGGGRPADADNATVQEPAEGRVPPPRPGAGGEPEGGARRNGPMRGESSDPAGAREGGPDSVAGTDDDRTRELPKVADRAPERGARDGGASRPVDRSPEADRREAAAAKGAAPARAERTDRTAPPPTDRTTREPGGDTSREPGADRDSGRGGSPAPDGRRDTRPAGGDGRAAGPTEGTRATPPADARRPTDGTRPGEARTAEGSRTPEGSRADDPRPAEGPRLAKGSHPAAGGDRHLRDARPDARRGDGARPADRHPRDARPAEGDRHPRDARPPESDRHPRDARPAEGGRPGDRHGPHQGGRPAPGRRGESEARPAPGNPYAAQHPGGAPRAGGYGHPGGPAPHPGQGAAPQGWGHGPQGGRPQGPVPPQQWQRYDPWDAPEREQRARRGGKGAVVGAILIALIAGGVGGGLGIWYERNGGVGSAIELDQSPVDGDLERAPDSVAGIARTALPGVVTIHVSGSDEQGTGTGFVLDKAGHILTNNHVVAPAAEGGEITVTFAHNESARAKIVGRDSGYDLAVIKVSGVSGLKPLPLGNSDSVAVGDPVIAIGAPYNLANTVTSGIISAKERPITAGGKAEGSDVSYVDALQTDAPINPGNSGGPLLDRKGRVIGINSAIRAADVPEGEEGGQGGSIGLGFAIPVNQGKRVAEELINTGKATHPVIGVTVDMQYTGDGARVGESSGSKPSVTPGGPADQAGIRPGDVITEVDGDRVHNGEELIIKVRSHRPGDRLTLTVERDGDERTVDVVLGSSDGD